MKRVILLFLVVSMLLPSVRVWAEETEDMTPLIDELKGGIIDWEDGVVRATGMGAPPVGKPKPQARLMAKRAATADAYRQLAEVVNGVRVDSETVVKNYVTESDTIRTKVSGLIKGAKVVKEQGMSDGSYEVMIEMPLYGDDGLTEILIMEIIEEEEATAPAVSVGVSVREGEPGVPTASEVYAPPPAQPAPSRVSSPPPAQPAPSVQPAPSSAKKPPQAPERKGGIKLPPQAEAYTGLIVNARGLGVEPAMSPKIIDENGKEVYGTFKNVDPEEIINNGVVAYESSVGEAEKNPRVGQGAVVVEGIKPGGDAYKANVVLAAGDADKIRELNARDKFLDKMKVVIVL